MSTRDGLLASIANTIKDYRTGEIDEPTPEHVDRWVRQFDVAAQLPLLAELDHVFKRTYFNRNWVTQFLSSLLTNDKLAGSDPCSFWKGIKLLDNQGGGNSQREMLQLFNDFLKEECNLQIADCGENASTFMYLDDAIFTGNRVLNDISFWIETSAPTNATVHIITIGCHRGGKYYADTNIKKAARTAQKQIESTWRSCKWIEDRRKYINASDVLRPVCLPIDEQVAAYAESLKYKPDYRTPGSLGENKFFSSEQGRNVLEQELLKAGVKIRALCPDLNQYMRPLGNMVLETLGFGSTIVTFRNCPNNTPLAFWAGDPWYPLFPRKTN